MHAYMQKASDGDTGNGDPPPKDDPTKDVVETDTGNGDPPPK